jgi:lipopolysaccharide transport system permease protein
MASAEVAQSIALWRLWTRLGIQDVRMRFRRSVIGVGWIFLNLATVILAIGYIYGHLLGQDLHEFIPYLTVSLVIWGYLTSSIVEGGNAFVASEGYIKQISLPIYVYVLRFFVSIGLTSLISSCAFLVAAAAYRVQFSVGTLWTVPGVVLLMAVSLLLITILAHVNARFRDAANLSSAVMQVAFYATPVIFPARLLQSRGLRRIVDLNPLYHLLEVVRHPLLSGAPAGAESYVATILLIVALGTLAAAIVRLYGRRIVFSL